MANPFHALNGIRGGVHRTTQTWTNDGMQWTTHTTSYTSPGISFDTFGRGMRPSAPDFTSPARISTRSGLCEPRLANADMFGASFGLLKDMLNARTSHPSQAFAEEVRNTSSGRRIVVHDITETSDEDSESPEFVPVNSDHHRSRRRPEASSSMRENPARQQHDAPNYPSNGRPKSGHRDRSHRHDQRESRPRTRSDKSGRAESDPRSGRSHRHGKPADKHESMIEALRTVAKFESKAIDNCKRQLAESINQGIVRSEHIQPLVDELKRHEQAYKSANQQLQEVRETQRRERNERASRDHRSTSRARGSTKHVAQEATAGLPRRSATFFKVFEDMDEFEASSRNPSAGDFQQWFDDFDRNFPFDFTKFPFSSESTRNHGQSRGHRGSQSDQVPRPAAHPRSTNAVPPATMMTVAEAGRLYQDYDARWKALSPTDPSVPFPARGLRASALNARDTIWAPHVTSNISTWSEETIMQANAQAFFLGVVSLRPKYTQHIHTGKVEMGFDKTLASPAQVKELIDILKKEKTRWHSDRLGRRCGNAGGTNEALQKDERARAVFHAVCELMEAAQ